MKDIFAKYMEVKDPSQKAHAVLSASGSERWMHCPGSAKLSANIPPQDNVWSIAGTHAHTLMQFILEYYDEHVQLLAYKSSFKFREFIGFSEEQYAAVMVAVNYVQSEMARMQKQTGIKPLLYIEQKLELAGVGFGTADIIIYQPFGLLHVIDFKNGKHKVEPKNNTQGLYYLHAAADRFHWDFSEVWVTIIQPNAPHKDGPIRTWKTNEDTLEFAGMKLRAGARRTREPNPPLVVDAKWCWFCPAREKKCPAHQNVKHEKIMEKFQR